MLYKNWVENGKKTSFNFMFIYAEIQQKMEWKKFKDMLFWIFLFFLSQDQGVKKNSVIIYPIFVHNLVNYLILKRKFLVIYYNDWTTFCMFCIVKTEVQYVLYNKNSKNIDFNLSRVFYQSLEHCVTCQKQKLPKKIYYSMYT